MTEKLRIVFMGTPNFAVGVLDRILSEGYDVVGVITAADKPAGRGKKIKFSEVKEYALQKNLNILQPTNLKDSIFLEQLKNLQANLQIVVAFRMLPDVVWKMPKFGTFNLHASLLPNYRGAAPINWAIINGDTTTGVTTFFIDEKIDTGAIIRSKEINIHSNENAGSLHDKLQTIGAETVIETLKLIETGNVQTTIQTEQEPLKTANKLNKENCKINWQDTGINIYNKIRGLSPYPGAWCQFEDDIHQSDIKILETVFNKTTHDFRNGQIICTKKDIKVAVVDGFIHLNVLQMPGKKQMKAFEILNGMKISDKAKVF
ncbi:methionyl-tRNA formyltransferase [Flavobacterium branchiophilum]|uniref:Methionyl-tRNA formyltransferase n=1 Tax=Flavobacterium branchiophilum TaxID=55197 RepID=A0A2H3KS77_9FLAO|nr:methionyl-tRNA formyltransferase [Flavobacterium branchiophilum]PDS25024.1 methionyl-tRNA formyltransferase [Flavobacterium branchiophilum]